MKRLAHIPRRLHFVGIGGSGMSGIAEVCIARGHHVSGSDLKASAALDRLARLGATVHAGHDAAHLPADAGAVVVSSAVPPTNPEVAAARARRIPRLPRGEMLAELMRGHDGVAVAGAHGKTTTSALIAGVLVHAGCDPTVIVGGRLGGTGSGARAGTGPLMVVESDESDGSFLLLRPDVAVVTTIDREHLAYYGDEARLDAAFAAFANNVPSYGFVVSCADDPRVRALAAACARRCVTYGFDDDADWRADAVVFGAAEVSFDALRHGTRLGRVTSRVFGRHGVQNTLAALAACDGLGVDFPTAAAGLAAFAGVDRRFQVVGTCAGVTVVDDYGHHPAEIRATLDGARRAFPAHRCIAVFQPHRYSRTADLMDGFATAFMAATTLVVTDVYAAGEAAIAGADAATLAARARAAGHADVRYVASVDEVAAALAPALHAGDLVITFGAGDVFRAGAALLRQLEGRRGGDTDSPAPSANAGAPGARPQWTA